MTHNRGYNNKVKYKKYDMDKYKKKEKNHDYLIKKYKEEIKDMKLEMEMY